MSMLAEPRRKQKWSVDPRNSTWSNDDSKFGQKMLERMGWSKGKGLGRSEQGSTDHIKVKVKNNSYGLGANTSHEDKWIAHQDDFNDLLAQLNSHHGQNASNEASSEEKKGFSLEEKSKTSKKRVHYTKFTKGKDLSSRSETDLNCIFGKRARSAKNQEQESNGSDSQGEIEECATPATFQLDTESITKTVKSTLTMQEYFAQRMAQLKKARGGPSTESAETTCPTEELGPVHNSDDIEETKSKKKKKKNKKPADDIEVVEEKSTAPIVIIDEEDQEQECSRKKKKKRKMAENDNDATEDSSSTDVVEIISEEPPPSKKKKLKKRKERELLKRHLLTETETVDSEVIHNKKSHKEEDDVVKEDEGELVGKKSKKKKRKRESRE
ncbi:PIN2/TERF1-interacting telomerase inhibitor 1 isoform 2-T2 [Odontesthes bonariensis]|uniref:PIN2/TERF1-interacting telomerase inhibitor 1 isoform X2 n=1 Tax=Odontesthes bonariensis TaxID=219752 RepID=UPI003F5817B8